MDVINRKLSQIFSPGRLSINPLDNHFQSPRYVCKKLSRTTYKEIKESRRMILNKYRTAIET